ncbi:uncharacterized protein LOC110738655 [Chenopodium quinoa]|uniref:uncharacterized protein LOC110738655 n=1 Tax=Chenopodium quinoa TaxID=63459 RepID=UPI000B783A92|nr:uncharacterized protein LOC110738655 [Chenopodium quinoa]
MMNNKFSASKTQSKTEKKVKNPSPRNPLMVKNLNISSSCSSSFSSATSISSEAAAEASKGCLRFFLSNYSSTATKNASNRKPKSLIAHKTPKTAPNAKRLKVKLSENGGNLVKNCNNLRNPEKPISGNVKRLKKNPPTPCLYSWKSGKKPSSRSDFSVGSDARLCEKGVSFTPVGKNGCVSDLGEKESNGCDSISPIPPIQASVSPEIQGGSTSVVKATPTTCYAAGHVLSGVSDKRKCRPRGLLTIGNNDLFGSSKTKVFRSDDEGVLESFSKPRVSLVPFPSEASMQWILSPCDENSEDKDDDHGKSDVKLNECEVVLSPNSIGCSSSPMSSLGFSSELCNRSSCTATSSAATTISHSSRSRSPDFRGVLGPSFDHLVRSPSPTYPLYVPSSKVEVSPKLDKYRHDHEKEATPHSEDSIGSGNVIQTPQSDSSTESFGLSQLSRDEISRLWFESELDSVAEVLRRTSLSPGCDKPAVDSPKMSFEFNPLIRPDNSIDLANFRKAMDSQASPGIPESLLRSFHESEVRISWREGLSSRIFDMDELDCCRCFSDEENDADECNNPCESYTPPQVADTDSNKILDNAFVPNVLAHNKDNISQEDIERSPSKGTNSPCHDSSSGGGSADHVAKDSSWNVCFENHLFQV